MDEEEELLFRVSLTERHRPTGSTRHYGPLAENGFGLQPAPASLQIYRIGAGIYLFYLDEAGAVQTDTFHLDLEDAFHQAHLEFGVERGDWEKVSQ